VSVPRKAKVPENGSEDGHRVNWSNLNEKGHFFTKIDCIYPPIISLHHHKLS
jgi:hypothetical protein